jgi:leucyl aminopeptidase (aminopeptidase T)
MVAHVESLPRYLDLEGTHAALKLLREVLSVQPGETVVITNDSSGDYRVSALVAGAAQSLGAIPIELNTATALNAGTDPPEPVAQALYAAAVWVELSRAYILDSATQRRAQERGVRYICLTGVDVDTLVRTLGRIDLPALYELGQALADLTNAAEELELTCAGGSHLVARYSGRRALAETGSADPGAVLMLGGQTNIIPLEDTVTGTIIFNGSVWPPDAVGILTEPLPVRFDEGWATIEGASWQASRLREWLESFDDRSMFRFSHFSYGYNPGVLRPSGRVAEDERVFGCVCIGLGSQTVGLVDEPLSAPSHTDLTILRPTIRLGDQLLEEDGRYVHPALLGLCRALHAPGY